ncbi:MerR family transcriptional regulator [Evansella sp. AB-rgal1]|uniref:MerR family transcriptional regulator n=1 Tax=Evansella sp. AB-rgal1 TaxID=3242696 RepID=UPI00359D27EC
MTMPEKYSVGEFSERTGFSVRTLHYYDEIGILSPEKHPTSGHRKYTQQDIITLHKIMSLKLLGYSLEQISTLLHETSFTVDLNESLHQHLQALEKEKDRIEQSMNAIKRVIKVIEQEKEVDSAILLSIIYGMSTESSQEEWMKKNMLTDVADELSKKTEEEKSILDQGYIQLAKNVKELYGRPVDDPQVQQMVTSYLEKAFSFLGESLIQKLADANVEELDIQELEKTTSPFTEEEQNWLNEAMEYQMKQSEME